MHPRVLYLILTILNYQVSSQCYSNIEKGSCSSNVCYAHYYNHPEGFLEGFDCQESPTLQYQDCLKILQDSTLPGASVCVIKNETERHCCCLPSSTHKMCGSENRITFEYFDLWSTVQVLCFFLAIMATTLVTSLAHTFYDYAFSKWPGENSDFGANRTISILFIVRIIILFIISISLNFPFQKVCISHPNGRFFNPRSFLYSHFDDTMFSSVFFTICCVLCYFEYGLWKKYKASKKINRTAAITITLFLFLTIPVVITKPIIRTFELFEIEEQGYCKLGIMFNILVMCHVLYIIYDLILLFQIREIFKLDEDYMDDSSLESPEKIIPSITVSNTSTDLSYETNENEILEFSPKPFHVSRGSSSILKAKNNSQTEWITLRALLSTTGFYRLNPTKFIIPPGREISIEVIQITNSDENSFASQHNILIEWFFIGQGAPVVDINRFWTRPYIIPQSKWNFFVLPIYLETAN